jgi:hypothetical protein
MLKLFDKPIRQLHRGELIEALRIATSGDAPKGMEIARTLSPDSERVIRSGGHSLSDLRAVIDGDGLSDWYVYVCERRRLLEMLGIGFPASDYHPHNADLVQLVMDDNLDAMQASIMEAEVDEC